MTRFGTSSVHLMQMMIFSPSHRDVPVGRPCSRSAKADGRIASMQLAMTNFSPSLYLTSW